jgi:hypothetical protein
MRKVLLAIALIFCAAPVAAAAENTQCDAKPFSLGKPAASAPKSDTAQATTTGAKPVTAQAEEKKVQPKPKPRLLATCKDAKTKKKSG